MNGAMWVGLQSDAAEPSYLGAFVGLKPDPQRGSIHDEWPY